jgi:hypothetical protein
MDPQHAIELATTGGLGAVLGEALRALTKYLRYRTLRARVRTEADDEPAYGSVGWVWKELRRARGSWHAIRDRYEREVPALRERIAHLEGRHISGEQEAVRRESQGSIVVAPPRRRRP